jgi:hypothetical protein
VVIGTFVQEFSMQLIHLPNQVRVFALVPKARSRLNSVYMIIGFLGMSLGSVIGVQAWAAGGWYAVGYTQLGFAAAAMILWVLLDKDGKLRRFGKKPVANADEEAAKDEEVDVGKDSVALSEPVEKGVLPEEKEMVQTEKGTVSAEQTTGPLELKQ